MKLFAPTQTDGYKLGHGDMYADGTTKVYSNLTPRTDKIYRRGCTRFYDGSLVFFGGQAAIKEIVELWDESFFDHPWAKVSKRYKRRVDAYLGEGVVSLDRLKALHKLGYLPLEIKTLDEGLKVPMGIPVITITNTVDEHFWLVNYLETVLSDLTWKTSTNATIAAEYKAILKHYAKLTGTDDFTVSIQAHDFSCRGMSGPEDAARSGMAHLTQFVGTDTLSSMDAIEDYYGCEGLLATSVPATEHAVATNNILSIEQRLIKNGVGGDTRLLAETEFMKDLITRKFPRGIISYVADSFDFWSVLTKILPTLKDVITSREDDVNGLAKLVIRPDSGDPVEVICGKVVHQLKHEVTGQSEWEDVVSSFGYDIAQDAFNGDELEFFVRDIEGVVLRVKGYAYEEYDSTMHFGFDYVELANQTAEEKGAIETLWEIFGGEENEQGYKVLDRHIGLIYGDSITTKRCEEILHRLAEKGFQSGNVVFGVGSYTYQCNTRDTFGFAVKATYSVVNGQPVNIFKDPKTDSKKKSAKGLLFVGKDSDDELVLVDEVSPALEADKENHLTTRFKDGEFFNQTTLDEIRERLV
jgi:nicotinamide phosphoribosyltransferase